MPDEQNHDEPAIVSLGIDFTKRDEERRLVFGFAKFAEDPARRGYLYVDRQDDIITPADLEDVAYEYVLTSRDAGEMHVSKGAATLVESFMVTPEKLEKMGLPGDAIPQGWWVGYRVHDDDAWDRIKKGVYTGFSIEGTGVRQEVEVPDPDHLTMAPLAKCHPEGVAGLTDNEISERRQAINDAFRASEITQPERDRLLAELPPPRRVREVEARQIIERETESLVQRVLRMMGLTDDEEDA